MKVNIDSSNGLVLSGNIEQAITLANVELLTKICLPMASLGHNELRRVTSPGSGKTVKPMNS